MSETNERMTDKEIASLELLAAQGYNQESPCIAELQRQRALLLAELRVTQLERDRAIKVLNGATRIEFSREATVVKVGLSGSPYWQYANGDAHDFDSVIEACEVALAVEEDVSDVG